MDFYSITIHYASDMEIVILNTDISIIAIKMSNKHVHRYYNYNLEDDFWSLGLVSFSYKLQVIAKVPLIIASCFPGSI